MHVNVGGNSDHQEKTLHIEQADSAESRTLENCTTPLEIAFRGMEREFVYFLRKKDFITKIVQNRILAPVSVLSEEEKAGELVKWIKIRVKQDPVSYNVFLSHMMLYGNRYRPILNTLGKEFVEQYKR
jgi:hypothetical protein